MKTTILSDMEMACFKIIAVALRNGPSKINGYLWRVPVGHLFDIFGKEHTQLFTTEGLEQVEAARSIKNGYK